MEQIQQKIVFFDQSNQAKEAIVKSESDRLKLEIELNKLINSDESVKKSKALKLKAYYTKLCDDESNAITRNQNYLTNLQRIDSQFGQLETKLERLTNLKKECEIFLRTSYPKFMQENRIATNQEAVENILNDKNYSLNQGVGLIASNLQKINTLNENRVSDKYREPNFNSESLRNSADFQGNVGLSSARSYNQYENQQPYYQSPTQRRQSEAAESETERRNRELSLSPKQRTNSNISAYANLVPQLSLQSPTNRHEGNTKHEDMLNNLIPQAHSSLNKFAQDVHQTEDEETKIKDEYIKKLISSTIGELDKNNTNADNSPQKNLEVTQGNFGGLNTTQNILIKEYEEALNTEMNDTLGNTNAMTRGLASLVQVAMPKDDPLVEQKSPPSLKANDSVKMRRSNVTSPISEESERDLTRSKSKLEDNLELSKNGLYRLLSYIELEMRHTIHPEKYYRQTTLNNKNKQEIIRYANEDNGALNTMDSTDISMVIHDQLPIVIRKHTSKSCLFTSELLLHTVSDISEKIVRHSLDNLNDKDLWDHLFKHFLSLKKTSLLDSGSIGELFAAAMVGDEFSPNKAKAAKFLERAINLGSAQINDPLAESHSFTETSMNKSLLLASNSKLKETSAYQQFILGSTGHSNKSTMNKNEEEDDYDDDDIDALVAPKSTTSNLKTPYNPINSILKSPRKSELDFSSASEGQMKSSKVDNLVKNLRSSNDNKKLPVYLRDFEDSEDSEVDTDVDTEQVQKLKSVRSNNEYDFYN